MIEFDIGAVLAGVLISGLVVGLIRVGILVLFRRGVSWKSEK